jgi:uncharacterized protein
MGLDFFREVVALQKKYGAHGATVSNGLQTNATLLTSEFAQFLHEYHFLLGVSLDGPQHLHDRYRVTADSRGSFSKVMRGIELLNKHQVEFNILVLVSASNVDHAAEIYSFLTAQGLHYHQYIPCVEYDSTGALQPFAITAAQWGRFLTEIFDCWYPNDTRTVSVRQFDSVISYLVEGRYTQCTMGRSCQQYFVIEHNGDIYPCDFFVDPALKLGNCSSDTFAQMLQSPKYQKFGRAKSLWHKNCNQCPYVMLCSGDCQKHRFGSPATPQTLSSLCGGWKAFYAHTLPHFETLAQQVRWQHAPSATPEAATTAVPTAGRNDPCPCGSGKKFKKCCGR